MFFYSLTLNIKFSKLLQFNTVRNKINYYERNNGSYFANFMYGILKTGLNLHYLDRTYYPLWFFPYRLHKCI